jgi:hypothetical protein
LDVQGNAVEDGQGFAVEIETVADIVDVNPRARRNCSVEPPKLISSTSRLRFAK